jgi:hypothetical protein
VGVLDISMPAANRNHAVIATKHYRGTRRGSDGDGRRSNTIVVPQQPLQHRGEERRGEERRRGGW